MEEIRTEKRKSFLMLLPQPEYEKHDAMSWKKHRKELDRLEEIDKEAGPHQIEIGKFYTQKKRTLAGGRKV